MCSGCESENGGVMLKVEIWLAFIGRVEKVSSINNDARPERRVCENLQPRLTWNEGEKGSFEP